MALKTLFRWPTVSPNFSRSALERPCTSSTVQMSGKLVREIFREALSHGGEPEGTVVTERSDKAP